MAITILNISYPDFRLLDVIDPEQFDANNAEIVAKINEILNKLNTGLTATDIGVGALTGNNLAVGSIGMDKLVVGVQNQIREADAYKFRGIPLLAFTPTLDDDGKVLAYDNETNSFKFESVANGKQENVTSIAMQIDTSNKIQKYLDGDTSDVNYVRIKDQNVELRTATTTGAENEQAKDRYGANLYWTTASRTELTLKATPHPVYVYKYIEDTKRKIGFENINGSYIPIDVFGAGVLDGANNGKGFIRKLTDRLELEYVSSVGNSRKITLGEGGITLDPYDLTGLNFYNNGFTANYGADYVSMRWTLDGDGRITTLTNIKTNELIDVNYIDSDI